MPSELYTIGHSNHTLEHFIDLLTMNGITAICDVRSYPQSKFNPQFNSESIQSKLEKLGIKYVYCGKELGGRNTHNSDLNSQVYIDYKRIAQTQLFNDGLTRLRNGMKNYRIALMCAEKDPILCHRAILICRFMRKEDISIKHILENGSIESHQELETRLLKSLNLPNKDLFYDEQQIIEQAYDAQSKRLVQHENNYKLNIDNRSNISNDITHVYTIGFTKKSAKEFFQRLSEIGIKRVLDIRLNNSSQLAGFTKEADLKYFLRTICNIDYKYIPELAPTQDILDAYRKKRIDWAGYEKSFLELMTTRKVENLVSRSILDKACFLCSEDKPNKCHRRLVTEYLKSKLGNIEVTHID